MGENTGDSKRATELERTGGGQIMWIIKKNSWREGSFGNSNNNRKKNSQIPKERWLLSAARNPSIGQLEPIYGYMDFLRPNTNNEVSYSFDWQDKTCSVCGSLQTPLHRLSSLLFCLHAWLCEGD